MSAKYWQHSFEFNATRHCMNKCVACNHFSPIAAPSFLDPDVLRADLAHLATIAYSSQIAMLGGEPLLHPRIVELLQIARASGVAPIVRVVTNGQLLARMDDAFYRNVNAITLDDYKLTQAELQTIRGKCQQFNVSLDERRDLSFFKVLRRVALSDEQARHYFLNCYYGRHCTLIHEGYIYRCPQMSYIPGLFLGMDANADGVKLTDLKTPDDMRAFIAHTNTPHSCKICVRDEAMITWRETTKENWLTDSTL